MDDGAGPIDEIFRTAIVECAVGAGLDGIKISVQGDLTVGDVGGVYGKFIEFSVRKPVDDDDEVEDVSRADEVVNTNTS